MLTPAACVHACMRAGACLRLCVCLCARVRVCARVFICSPRGLAVSQHAHGLRRTVSDGANWSAPPRRGCLVRPQIHLLEYAEQTNLVDCKAVWSHGSEIWAQATAPRGEVQGCPRALHFVFCHLCPGLVSSILLHPFLEASARQSKKCHLFKPPIEGVLWLYGYSYGSVGL